jgi:DNA polymerase III delta prime subunit
MMDWIPTLAAIEQAIKHEMAASKKKSRDQWLQIDALEKLNNGSVNSILYKIVFSGQVHFQADHILTFMLRSSKERIQAIVIRVDDDGIVVECDEPIPDDARVMKVSFDPTFILSALEKFITKRLELSHPLADRVINKELPNPVTKDISFGDHVSLNEDQKRSVQEMLGTPFYLLWGPPGTGKTTTLGVALASFIAEGKSILVVSNSNAAVDVALLSLTKNLDYDGRKKVYRLGATTDLRASRYTESGLLEDNDFDLAQKIATTREELSVAKEKALLPDQKYREVAALRTTMRDCDRKLSLYAVRQAEVLEKAKKGKQATFCTLAKLVLDSELREKHFDVVCLDEASMAPMVFSLAASFMASSNFIVAGDPKQLPPIAHSTENEEVSKWFKYNIYRWFNVSSSNTAMLSTQFRMSDAIGSLVGSLSYSDGLKHGRHHSGTPVEFINVPREWTHNYYSVTEKSYFNFSSIPILHSMVDFFERGDILLLTPFRPQRSLLAALAVDLKDRNPKVDSIKASTIHKSQGSEASIVIVDLTTHDTQSLVAFFKDEQSELLFNVAISRAQDHLVIIGNIEMLAALRPQSSFWNRVYDFMRADAYPAEELFQVIAENEVVHTTDKSRPSILSNVGGLIRSHAIFKRFSKDQSHRKLFVHHGSSDQTNEMGDAISRKGGATNCPDAYISGGCVSLPLSEGWVSQLSPNVSSVLWRIAYSHLAEEDPSGEAAFRFFCPDCHTGQLVLQKIAGMGWTLTCTNRSSRECDHPPKFVSLEDVKVKVRLQGMRCPSGHPMTARSSSNGIFLGCENYPQCDYRESLKILDGL